MADDTSQGRALPVPASRVSRLTRIGTMAAGVAGNMAMGGIGQLGQGKRPKVRDLLLTPRNMTRVAEQLAQMRGAAMKMGQLISMDTGDALPAELSQIFARLRDDAHFMPPQQLRQVLANAWGRDWLGAFKSFDVRPIAAASIGQVHRALLRDGRDMAIKVQYPGVARSIDSDVANVGALIRMSGLLPKGFALDDYLEEGRKQLHEETDYALEAQRAQSFQGLLAESEKFVVPQIFSDWSTPHVLSMAFIPSRPIEDLAKEPQETRDRVAGDLITLLLRELFVFGLMQTDPNFANYRYCAVTGRIVLLDFGATRALGGDITAPYHRLLAAALTQDMAGLESAALEIGFFDATTSFEHRARIMGMMQMASSTLCGAETFDFTDTTLSQALQKEGIALADSGFVPPPLPIDVLFLQRKFGGMFLLASRLGATLPLRNMLCKALG